MSQAKELRLTKDEVMQLHQTMYNQAKEIETLKRRLTRTESELAVAVHALRRFAKNM